MQDKIQNALKCEEGLSRELTQGQSSMIAIGGAIGTGLFLGTGYTIHSAGPGVILLYVLAAVLTFFLMGSLAEMSAVYPTAGGFGTHAQIFISPFAGFLVRYCYLSAMVCTIGVELSAINVYMQYWFHNIPGMIWIILFSSILILVNSRNVKYFGTFEYWFAMLKILAIFIFICIGITVLIFYGARADVGVENLYKNKGFFPNGFAGIWHGFFLVFMSYFGIEIVAITAGESKNPQKAIPAALRSTLFRLAFFYIFTVLIMVLVIPWQKASGEKSPMVLMMELLKIKYAGMIMNFVVLIAALSAMNSALYISSRMLFPLSRSGNAPKFLENISRRGVPLYALLACAAGSALALAADLLIPKQAYIVTASISIFGAIFCWSFIFITHFFFRMRIGKIAVEKLNVKSFFYPFAPAAGIFLLIALLISSLWTEYRAMIFFGIPFIILLAIIYKIFIKRKREWE